MVVTDDRAARFLASVAELVTTPAAGSPAPLPDVMSVQEAASLLRLDRKTVYGAVTRGELPARRVGKRRIVIGRAALLRWLDGGR
ncbi:MAG: helix-turn-helix domain-containing protein [Kofleriaceae bacterium]